MNDDVGVGGYRDNAALPGVGGYQPLSEHDSDTDRFPAYPNVQPYQGSHEPGASPWLAGNDYWQGQPMGQAGPQAPTRRRRRGITLALCSLLVMFLVAGAIILGVTNSSTNAGGTTMAPSTTAATTSPSTTAATTPPKPPPEPRGYTPRSEVVVPPAVDGWQSVAGTDGIYAYDVPPNWEPKPGHVHGWGGDDGGPIVTLSTSAYFGSGGCPGEPARHKGGSGVMSAQKTDSGSAAEEAATAVAKYNFAEDNAPEPQLSVRGRQPVEVALGAGGKRAATMVFVDARTAGGACLPETGLVGALALESDPNVGSGTPVLVAYADQGVDEAPSADELAKILTSLRSVPTGDRHTVQRTPTSGPVPPEGPN